MYFENSVLEIYKFKFFITAYLLSCMGKTTCNFKCETENLKLYYILKFYKIG